MLPIPHPADVWRKVHRDLSDAIGPIAATYALSMRVVMYGIYLSLFIYPSSSITVATAPPLHLLRRAHEHENEHEHEAPHIRLAQGDWGDYTRGHRMSL